MEKWEGKVVVVTGASGGVAAGICKLLSKSGMMVCAFTRRVDKVEAMRAEIPGFEINLNAVECDIRSEISVQACFHWIEKQYGEVSLLVNNAGVLTNKLLTDLDNTRDLHRIFEINLIGPCLCTKTALKHGVKHVINIGSVFGQKVHVCVPGIKPINGLHPASKFGVNALSEGMRQELIYLNTGVKVTNIIPGLTRDDIVAQNTDSDVVRFSPKLDPFDVAEAVVYAITRPDHVVIHEITIKPIGEFI